ncbi:MAG: hypothetical protein JO036_06100 [Candidatus Eremiobacteraeota bacterium]|nr:hypothetical protein [Candidatus Eremiobacteraeota bacterium]
MKTVTVRIVRDPESPAWWLAQFKLNGRSWCTQGAIVDEARYMAADLLKLAGASDDVVVNFAYDDRESLASLLAHPVTPSLLSEEEAAAQLAEEGDDDLDQELLAALRS